VGAALIIVFFHRLFYSFIAGAFHVTTWSRISADKLWLYNLPIGILCYCVVLSVALVNYARDQKEYARHHEQVALNKENRIQLLQLQLQPHMIRNTLSSISSVIDRDPAKADTMITRLGDFLRLVNSEALRVSVEEELKCVQFFLDIEEVRLEDRLQVVYKIEDYALPALVPSLILQPIIENAIRHGRKDIAKILTVVVTVRLEGDKLQLLVEDDGPDWNPHNINSHTKSGIENIKQRLESMYSIHARFELTRTQQQTRALIELPCAFE
jgi:LytS/YehU family sensor histidine kinase